MNLRKNDMNKMKFSALMISTALVLNGVVNGEGNNDALSKGNYTELSQSEQLVASAGNALIKQAETALSKGVYSLLDVLNAQLSVLETKLGILKLNDFIDVDVASQVSIEEKKRSLATEIKANLEAQLHIKKLNYTNGVIGPKEMMFLELKLYLFLLEEHELMGLDESVLESQVFDLMGKLSKLRDEGLKHGIGV